MYGDPNTPMAGWDMRIVMQPDGSYAPIPQYMVEDEAPVEQEDEVEQEDNAEGGYLPATAPDYFEYNGVTYPNPEADDSYTYQKTEGPFGTPGGTVVQHHYVGEDGYLIIVSVHSDGQYEIMYGDPNTPMAGWDMRIVMQPDGSYAPIPQYMVEDEAPVAGEPDADEPAWLMGGPAEFHVGDGVTFPNPEYDNEFTYTGSSPDGTQHYYEDSNGYKAVIVQGENQHTVWYGENPPAQNDLVIRVNASGEHEIDYYPAGEAQAQPEESAEEAEEDVFEAWTAHLPGYFPVDGVSYVNPEAYQGGNNSFTLIDESETQRVYESNGYLVRITQQPGGMFSFEWGSELGNPDLAMDVSADGTPTITYNAADLPEEPVQSQSLGTAVPINFAEETPDVDGESDGEGDSSEETPLFNAEKVLAMPEVEAQPESMVSREAMVQLPADPDPQPEVEHQEFSSISAESEDAAEDIDDDDDDPTGP
jgi:hypothetical protein